MLSVESLGLWEDAAADGSRYPAFRRLLPKSVVPLAMAIGISSNVSDATNVAAMGKSIGSLEYTDKTSIVWYINDD